MKQANPSNINFYIIMANNYNRHISLKHFKFNFLCIYQFLFTNNTNKFTNNTIYPYLNKNIFLRLSSTLMS